MLSDAGRSASSRELMEGVLERASNLLQGFAIRIHLYDLTWLSCFGINRVSKAAGAGTQISSEQVRNGSVSEPLRQTAVIAARASAMLTEAVGSVPASRRGARWHGARLHRAMDAMTTHVAVVVNVADAASLLSRRRRRPGERWIGGAERHKHQCKYAR